MEQTIKHLCHARGCPIAVPPKLLMCIRHWRMVPRDIQRRVWAHYRPGQEIDKRPTRQYLEVMNEAIQAVAARELELAQSTPYTGTGV